MSAAEEYIYMTNAEEPFEADLRGRLYDIMDDWEEYAEKLAHPALQKEIRAMIDQIDDAMHPPEEE